MVVGKDDNNNEGGSQNQKKKRIRKKDMQAMLANLEKEADNL